MIRNNIVVIVAMIFFHCHAFSQSAKESKLILRGNNYFFQNNEDSIKIGTSSLSKDLFKDLAPNLFPNIQYSGIEPQQPIDVYYEIAGIYVSLKLFDCFTIENGKPKKQSNDFDVLLIYPEESRYNFQFNNITGYRIFHYHGFFYQVPSSRENLSYFIMDISISKYKKNTVVLKYVDKSNYIKGENTIENMVLTVCPTISIEFKDKNQQVIQPNNQYILLSEDFNKNINVSIPGWILPQDFLEIYIQEIITHLINLKYSTNYKTEEIIEKL